MLVIPLKPTVRYDLRGPLAQWLDGGGDKNNNSKNVLPANPLRYVHLRPSFRSADCRKDLVRLASLRSCLHEALLTRSHKVALDERALSDAHEYHAALLAFEARGFPTTDEVVMAGEKDCLKLEWSAAVGPQTEMHGSLVWDRACTIWNIAALESYLASRANLGTPEGCKAGAKHSQQAASLVRHLRERVVPGQNFDTVDLSVPSLQFWESVCLAQAQVCAYRLAQVNNTSSPPRQSLLSYLAVGAVPLWNDALTYSKDPLILSQLPKPAAEWGAHCKAWSMYLTAKAESHQAAANRDAKEWGVELAWLKKCCASIKACKEFVDSANKPTAVVLEDELSHAVNDLWRQVQDRQAQAVKDNRVTYGERVPDEVPPIRPQQLAKSDLPLPESMLTPKVALFSNLKK